MTDQPTGPACGNNPNFQMSDGDRKAVAEFRAYLADRAALRDRITEALITTSREEWPYTPGQEKWDHHKHGDRPGHNYAISCALCTNDVDRLAAAVLAVLPEPTDQAAEEQLGEELDAAAESIANRTVQNRKLEGDLATARATNERLNLRAQRLESELAAYRRAVADWEISDQGTYVPLRTLAAIAKASGLDVPDRWELHYQRVERLETGRAAALLDAADALGRMDYDTDSQDYGYDTYRDAWNGGVMDGAALLRRLAGEQPAQGEAERCTRCGHPKRDHDGRADHRAKYSPLVAGEPWCHACNAPCDYAGAQQQPETGARPARGDAFEAWLKTQRDAAADYPEAYQATDGLLDLYRLHADTGTPLSEHVCEGRVAGDCECLEPYLTPSGNVRVDHLLRGKSSAPAPVAQQPDGRCPACGHTVCDGDGPCGALSGSDFCTCHGLAAAAEQQPAAADTDEEV